MMNENAAASVTAVEPMPIAAVRSARASRISVVVPAMDEEDSLPILVERVVGVCAAAGIDLAEIILIDDGSADRTWSVMESLAAERPVVRSIRLRRNFGKATALMVGIEASTGDIVVTMDADLQDDPDELPAFLAKLDEGYDLVSGWKEKRNDPTSKTLPSRFFNKVTSRMSGIDLHDFNCGYKAYRREIFNSVQLYGELHRYVPVLAHALGYRVGELSVRHHARQFGRSKYGFKRFLRGFLDLLTVMMITRYAYRPAHLFGGIGTLLSASGSVILGYLFLLKVFTGASIGDRPLLLLGALLVIVGVQFLLFGLLAELVINRSGRMYGADDLVARRVGYDRA